MGTVSVWPGFWHRILCSRLAQTWLEKWTGGLLKHHHHHFNIPFLWLIMGRMVASKLHEVVDQPLVTFTRFILIRSLLVIVYSWLWECVSLFIFKCHWFFRWLHGSAPPYLEKCCTRMIPRRLDLRTATAASGRLVVPKTNTKTISGQAFAISCPLAWNSLPDELHDDSLSFADFRRKFKTFLFYQTLNTILTQLCLFTYFDVSMTSAIFIMNFDHQMSVWWSKNRRYATVGSPPHLCSKPA